MNGWFEVARISCSARALLIFFRSIISFFERTAVGRISISISLERKANKHNETQAQTFHRIKLPSFLLSHEIHLPNIAPPKQLYFLKAARGHLNRAHLDRVARICPSEWRLRGINLRWGQSRPERAPNRACASATAALRRRRNG